MAFLLRVSLALPLLCFVSSVVPNVMNSFPRSVAGKTITFTNCIVAGKTIGFEQAVQFKNDHDLQCFFATNRISYVNAVDDTDGTGQRSLAAMESTKKYVIRYVPDISEGAGTRFSNFIDNNSKAFEAKANVAVVEELVRHGHTSAKLMCASQELIDGIVEGELDGVVETDSHLFVVEAKVHAKVADVYHVVANMNRLVNPVYGLIDPTDPRRNNVIGILATSTVTSSELQAEIRKVSVPIWLLTADGSGMRLEIPSPQ